MKDEGSNKQIGYRGVYDPNSPGQYRISRSKVDLFLNCPRCFWLECVKDIKRPRGFPFNINSAIDELYKKEFDQYRTDQKQHPIMVEYKLDGVLPYQHQDIEDWRENFIGMQYSHEDLGLVLFGALDDVWYKKTKSGEDQLIVVDYKSTSKKGEVTLDAPWQIGYKRQMEFYQWLLSSLGFNVASTGYFVYTNGDSDAPEFKDTLRFKTKLLSYKGDYSWVEPALIELKKVLDSTQIPKFDPSCEYCSYAGQRLKLSWS